MNVLMNRNGEKMSEKLYGQSYFKRDGEVIAVIRENGNSSYSIAGTERMNLNDAKKVLDDYCTLEKNLKFLLLYPMKLSL